MNIERILMRSPSESAEHQRAAYRAQKEKLKQQEQTESLEVGQKRCFKCLQIKSLSEFYSHPMSAIELKQRIEEIVEEIKEWKDHERAALLSELTSVFCQHCGQIGSLCHCTNDE